MYNGVMKGFGLKITSDEKYALNLISVKYKVNLRNLVISIIEDLINMNKTGDIENKEGLITQQVFIPEDLHKEYKNVCKLHNYTMSELFRKELKVRMQSDIDEF